MKKILFNILFAAGLLISLEGTSQVKKDSILVLSVKKMQTELNLSDDVAGQVLVALQDRVHDMQLINNKISAEDRKDQFRQIRRNYYSRLKKLLTPEQWTLYQQREAASLERFKGQMKKKKVNTKELQ